LRQLRPVTFDRKGRAEKDLRDFRPRLPTEEQEEAVAVEADVTETDVTETDTETDVTDTDVTDTDEADAVVKKRRPAKP